MTDRMWCQNCNETRYRPTYSDTCYYCKSELEDAIPLRARVSEAVAAVLGLVVLAAVVLGPLAAGVSSILVDGGVLVGLSTLIVWSVIVVTGWAMAVGKLPAPPRGL
jgi:hypothetical protein